MNVMFCGHGQYRYTPEIRERLEREVEQLILDGATMFFHGGYGQFDHMAASVVWRLKGKYPHIESVLVLPYLDRAVDASIYDSTTYPPLEKVPRKYAIARRNRWMVENSDVIIAFVRHSWGGAAVTLEYAERKGLRVIQLADLRI